MNDTAKHIIKLAEAGKLPSTFRRLRPDEVPIRCSFAGTTLESPTCSQILEAGDLAPDWTTHENYADWNEYHRLECPISDLLPECINCSATDMAKDFTADIRDVNPSGVITSSDIACMEAGYIEPQRLLHTLSENAHTRGIRHRFDGIWFDAFRMHWEQETNSVLFESAPLDWLAKRLESLKQFEEEAYSEERSIDEARIANFICRDHTGIPPRARAFLAKLASQ